MRLLTINDLNQPPEVLAPLVSNAQTLSGLYFDYIQTHNDSYEYTVQIFGERERSSGIHASEISRCVRQMTYSITGTQRQVSNDTRDANMQMRFNLGHGVHAMLQNDFKRICARTNGLLEFQEEVKIAPSLQPMAEKWGLHSHCDGVFTFYFVDPNGQRLPYMRVGLEIKTKSGPEFEKLKSPDSDHLEQTNLYMAALDLPLMWILYYNKSNSNITTSYPPWLYKFDAKLWSEQLEPRFQTAYEHAHAQQLPDRQEGMYCRWCPFSWHCLPKVLASKRPTTISPGMLVRK